MGPPSYMQSIVDRNVVMRRTTVFCDVISRCDTCTGVGMSPLCILCPQFILYIVTQWLCYGTSVVYAVRRWPKRRYAAHTSTYFLTVRHTPGRTMKWPPRGCGPVLAQVASTQLHYIIGICGVTSPRQFPLTQTGTHPLSEDKGYNSMRSFGFNQLTHTCDWNHNRL